MAADDQAQGEDKLRELVVYLAARCADDPSFGSAKLRGLLYRCDFRAFKDLGASITGAEYVRIGTEVVPRDLLQLQRAMESRRDVVLWRKSLPGQMNPQDRIVPLREPTLDLFNSRQVALIDRVVQECWLKTDAELSRESADDIGWQLARDGEAVPYETALIESIEPAKSFDARAAAKASNVRK